ncbi:hypothetical protein AVEN_191480-1 [Araneus ventricosus]|uniref:Uncharacterized protein n=1 Tax=Araneus ventricosus TaxID=182803 RepID=A0A4Y2PQ67_ARAVE|nr:hypothetical protein AVEN_191480-1 [Araneus ventricosus]
MSEISNILITLMNKVLMRDETFFIIFINEDTEKYDDDDCSGYFENSGENDDDSVNYQDFKYAPVAYRAGGIEYSSKELPGECISAKITI